MLQQYATCLFKLPTALCLPPQLVFVHNELNMIFQVLSHTQTIPKMHWFVELVFNTPSHHRVHHGQNEYCLDKNYGGFLIIWDRFFGTFQQEIEDDQHEIIYGLDGHQVLTFNAFYCQVCMMKILVLLNFKLNFNIFSSDVSFLACFARSFVNGFDKKSILVHFQASRLVYS